jgi:hypothetical protein
MIPLGDASRRPVNFPIVTSLLIAANALVFVLELADGDAFINRWSLVPADITAGRNLITILSAMFMHAGWMHILSNGCFPHHLSTRSHPHYPVLRLVCAHNFHPGYYLGRLLVPDTTVQRGRRISPDTERRRGLHGAHWRLYLRRADSAVIRISCASL